MNIVIPCAFILLACALIWFLIGARGSWFLKLFLMFLTLVVGFEIWGGINSYMGHPRNTSLSSVQVKSFMLFCTIINENGSSSAIYMLMTPENPEPTGMFSYRENDPQFFRFDYSRSLHKNAQEAMSEIVKQDGQPVEIMFTSPLAGQKSGKESSGKGHDQGANDPQLYILPPEKLPAKVH